MWRGRGRRPSQSGTGGRGVRGKRVRLRVTVSVLALVGTACTGSSAPGAVGQGPEAPTVPSETLLLGTGSGPLVVEIPAGSVTFEEPGAGAGLGGGGGGAARAAR